MKQNARNNPYILSEPQVGIGDEGDHSHQDILIPFEQKIKEMVPVKTKSWRFPTLLALTILLGLAIGSALAMLLVSGALSLTHQEIRQIFKIFKF